MEPAKIDWKSIKSEFEVDDLYEHINAPKWVDFSVSDESVDDEVWFCRPDCNHPKTVEDFLKSTPTSKVSNPVSLDIFPNSLSLLQKSASVSEILPLGDRNRRDSNLKRRGGIAQSSSQSNKDLKRDRFVADGENRNPNFSSTPSNQYNIMKSAIESASETKQVGHSAEKKEASRLKSTLSARNLFPGRDILSQITEFCNELKRLATRAKERENLEKSSVEKSPAAVKKEDAEECGSGAGAGAGGNNLGKKERKPLIEVGREKWEGTEKSNIAEKQRRKKRADEAENIPISVDVKNVIKRKAGENLMEIRTCPPSPQCFSATKGPPKAAPLKASRSKPQEMAILQELEQTNTELKRKEETAEEITGARRSASAVDERETRALDVFWFLKPCTISG
ncbi:hypothetical protein U1Q18_023311 [Sarracenia purpurea var. burkii]